MPVLSFSFSSSRRSSASFFIRLFQIPVYLEGNVIDLGVYKLQVVEACSGLRYLYPLMSLGFLAAYLFQAPLWQRALVFLSTIPITIFMNSLRIGMVGVLVDQFRAAGRRRIPAHVRRLDHFHRLRRRAGCGNVRCWPGFASGKDFFEVFYPPKLTPSQRARRSASRRSVRAPLVGCFVLCAQPASPRSSSPPGRRSFPTADPLRVSDRPRRMARAPSSLDQQTEQYLGLTDYIMSDYAKPDGRPVNFYVAYYAIAAIGPFAAFAQRLHSRQRLADHRLRAHALYQRQRKVSLPLNRVVITRGSEKQLVYYWFEERGMKIANEYLSKIVSAQRRDVRESHRRRVGPSDDSGLSRRKRNRGRQATAGIHRSRGAQSLSAYLPTADTPKPSPR